MNVSEEELRERYKQLPDEELLSIWDRGTLIDTAQSLLKEELLIRRLDFQEQEASTEIDDPPVQEEKDYPGPWVTVAQFTTGPEAHILRARLESEDIPAIIADEHLVTANWFLSNVVGGVRVRVPRSCAQQASEIVKDLEQGKFAITDADNNERALRCPQCHSDDTTQHKRSWKISFLIFYFLHIPIPYYTNEYRCNQCGHVWKEESSKSG